MTSCEEVKGFCVKGESADFLIQRSVVSLGAPLTRL